jgi:hypothetical protein
MAPPGKIYHWKHGWIPLDHYAQLQAATKTPKVTNVGREKVHDQYGGYGYASGDSPYKTVFTVEGAPDVLVEEYHRSASGLEDPDIHGWAGGYNSCASHRCQEDRAGQGCAGLSGCLSWPEGEAETADLRGSFGWRFMGETDTSGEEGNHGIAFDTVIWNAKKVEDELTRGKFFGIPNQAADAAEYHKRVVFHEMSHVLHLTSEDDSGVEHFDEMSAFTKTRRIDVNPLNALADEPVTPREMGYTRGSPRHSPGKAR